MAGGFATDIRCKNKRGWQGMPFQSAISTGGQCAAAAKTQDVHALNGRSAVKTQGAFASFLVYGLAHDKRHAVYHCTKNT